jgi:hypothetical protein
MAEKKSRKKQRSLDTTAAEGQVLDSIQDSVAELNLQAIESGFRIGEKEYLSRLDDDAGFWNARYRGKVSRVLVHIVPLGDDYRLEFAPQDVSRHLGGANTKTGAYPKVSLVFRIIPLSKQGSNTYVILKGWSWILYFVLSEHLPSTLNSSEAIRAISFADGILGAGDYTFRFHSWGLVGVLKRETTIRLFSPPREVRYGDMTDKLASLLQADRAPQAEDEATAVQGSFLEDEEDE